MGAFTGNLDVGEYRTDLGGIRTASWGFRWTQPTGVAVMNVCYSIWTHFAHPAEHFLADCSLRISRSFNRGFAFSYRRPHNFDSGSSSRLEGKHFSCDCVPLWNAVSSQ